MAQQSDRRALLAGLPNRGQALERQRANLDKFVAANQDAFNAMRYDPWTRVPAEAGPSRCLFDIRASSVRGLRGVYLREPLPASTHEVRLLYYPGLIVTNELYQLFYQQYYCPTGLELPALQYTDTDGQTVSFVIIGDPTSAGALVNDGCYGRNDDSAVNCMLKSCRKEHLPRLLTTLRTGKRRISAEVAGVWSLADKAIMPTEELMLDYGGKSFWQPEKSYCAACFERTESFDNPLIICAGFGQTSCPVARHRHCLTFPPTLADLGSGSLGYYCPDHLAQLVTSPSTSQLPSTPRASSRSEPLWTPPPPSRVLPEPLWTPPSPSMDSSVLTNSSSLAVRRSLREDQTAPSRSDSPLMPRPSALRSINFDCSSILDADSAAATPRLCSQVVVVFDPGKRNFGRVCGNHDSDFEESESGSDDCASDASESTDSQSERSDAITQIRRTKSAASFSDLVSISPSVQEARALVGPSVGITATRAALTIRTTNQSKELKDYATYSTITEAQWMKCSTVFAGFARIGSVESRRPWFITQEDAKPYQAPKRPKRKENEDAQPQAGLLVRSDSILSSQGPTPMDIDDGAIVDRDLIASAPSSASSSRSIVSSKTSATTSNRWREREYLQSDYAEYRSCCGMPTNWVEQLKAAGLAANVDLIANHCSHSVDAFYHARLKYRSEFSDKASFYLAVARELLLGKPHWIGLEVCCSCFRAALGIGRGAVFRLSKPVEKADFSFPTLTQSGTLKKTRRAPVRERAVNLLRSFCLHVGGQNAPNQKNMDPNRKRYTVPQKQMNEFAQALLAFDQEARGLMEPEPLSFSAIYRAMAHLEVYDSHYISLGKGNSLCRCSVCDKLDNQCTPAFVKDNKLTQKHVMRFKAQKLSHLAQMREQREHFDMHKEKSMQRPEDEWCITFDGMDQSKTQLPSRARFSKDLEPLARLKLHWIGAFCFGGPDPVLGLMNTQELRKDSALSVVTLERILDLQWLELEKRHRACVRVAASQAAASQAAAEDDQIPSTAGDLDDHASTIDSSALTYSGPGLKWPRRLHLTFDNAGGESKNQWMMRFLGLLVFHGIFEAITVSMLLVGHTHDIVDQMFSVWSRMLRIYNAETYEKMKLLFRERYHSRIDGLVDLMRGQEEAYNSLSKEEQDAFNAEVQEAGSQWNGDQADILADFSSFVRDHKLHPHIEQQTVTIDAEGWLSKAVTGKLPGLSGIKKAYNFGVEKDKEGNVFLYNSQFAKSAERTTGPAIHAYPNQITGSWTTRAILYKAGDPGLSYDPYRTPPLSLDLSPLRITVLKYVEHKAMNAEERSDFNAMLDRLEQGQIKQNADCKDCYEALTLFGGHGVVSQRKNATPDEQAAAKKKLSSRNKSWESLQAHLRDPKFSAVHNAHMVHNGFWTKWLKRRAEHIAPAAIERGFSFDPADLAAPYHPAETNLCSGVGEAPVHRDRAERIDLIYLHKRGTPVEGQVAIQRTSFSREPFYVCVILNVKTSAKLRKLRHQTETEDSVQPAAAAVAAHAEASLPAAAAVDEVQQPARLKDLEFSVKYYDLCPEDYARLHLTAEEDSQSKKTEAAHWWSKQFTTHEQTEDALTEAMEQATTNRKPAPARPSWLVDLYAEARFIEDLPSEDVISGATLVAWGSLDEILKPAGKSRSRKAWKLRENVWKQLREDLTESKQDKPQTGSNAATQRHSHHSSNGKKRSSDRHDDDSDFNVEDSGQVDAGGREPSAAAAAAVTPSRPRLPRSAHAIAAIIDHNDDEEEAGHEDEDQDEDESARESAAAESDVDSNLDLGNVSRKLQSCKEKNQGSKKGKQLTQQPPTCAAQQPAKKKRKGQR